MVLTVGYDIENLPDPVIRKAYTGEMATGPSWKKRSETCPR